MRFVRRSLIVCATAVVLSGGGLFPVAAAQPVDGGAPPEFGSLAPVGVGVDESVGFTSRGLTFHGSLRIPENSAPNVAALLIPGSGPTDRNGNQPGIFGETLRRTADLLAERGITSYRFDKIGSGETGLAGLAVDQLADYGYDDQVADAAAAATLLSERTAVAAEDLVVVGHSEGGLTALVLATRGAAGGGTALLQPLPMRYLDLIAAQIATIADDPMSPADDRERLIADTDRAIISLRETGTIPADLSPELGRFGLTQTNARFLAEADAYDPVALAAQLPAGLPTLLTCSAKDLNVSCAQLDRLRAALAHTDFYDAQFATADHLLGELGPLPPSPADLIVPLPVSSEYAATMSAWADARAR